MRQTEGAQKAYDHSLLKQRIGQRLCRAGIGKNEHDEVGLRLDHIQTERAKRIRQKMKAASVQLQGPVEELSVAQSGDPGGMESG